MKSAHHLNIQGLQGVASGLDEEDASVDAVVNDIDTVNLVLSIEIGVKALLNVVDNGAPGLIVVDEVTETWGVDHGEAEAHTSLLNISAD